MMKDNDLRIRPSVYRCFSAITAPELYRNFFIHLFVMFPAAMLMCWLASLMDIRLGLKFFLPTKVSLVLGLCSIISGGLWVWFVYGYLFIAGGGSPGTHVDGGPVRMVDTGPYTAIRHPSVLGKLLGVSGLGLMWCSTTFIIAFLPILLIYSLISNRILQERFCEERFGPLYAEYRSIVPMIVPSPSGIKRWINSEAALPNEDLSADREQPPGIWTEFRWYLVGLLGLILVFAWAVMLV